jgi:DNA invertase Pin-like site-specific DNA recombinase
MTTKVSEHHLQKHACIYIRQSTPGQVRWNQESTDRQYNLMNKALSLGWKSEQIRVLDRDLGQSASAPTKRTDFKALVSDVAMGQIGAIFALEVSRLARSNQEWHRLLELCAITGTLVIDEDGSYDPADFNDSLVLGMKGTFAQAELHIIRARLHGGKLNKAERGELRFPLPVGFVFENDKIVLDPSPGGPGRSAYGLRIVRTRRHSLQHRSTFPGGRIAIPTPFVWRRLGREARLG